MKTIAIFLALMLPMTMSAQNYEAYHVNTKDNLSDNYVCDFAQDEQGVMWFATLRGVFRYDGYTFRRVRLDTEQHSMGRVNNLQQEGAQITALLSNGTTIAINTQTLLATTVYAPPAPLHPNRTKGYNVYDNQNRGMRFDANNGMLMYPEISTGKVVPIPVYSGMNGINVNKRLTVITARDGKAWIATYGNGLFLYDPQTGNISHFRHEAGKVSLLRSNYLVTAFEDRDGNIWLSEEYMGATCIRQSRLLARFIYFDNEHLQDRVNSIRLVKRLSRDRLIIANGVNQWRIVDNRLAVISQGKAPDDVIDALMDSQNHVWMATREAGILLDGKPVISPEQIGRVNALHFAPDGRLWLFSLRNGIFAYDLQTRKLERQINGGNRQQKNMELNGAVMGDNGRVMAAMNDTMALLVRRNGSLAAALAEKGEVSIIEDDSGRLWKGTSSGVVVDNGTESRNITLSKNSLSNACQENGIAIVGDSLLLGTRYGMAMLPLSLTSATQVAGESEHPCVMTSILVNGEDIPLNDELRLHYNENNVTINFSNLDYFALGVEYTYRLVGYDCEWSEPSSLGQASYRHLPRGIYTLMVKAKNANGEWLPETKILHFTVSQPWWFSWWAILLYFIVIGTLVYMEIRHLLHENRLRNKVKMEQQLMEHKLRLFTNISHEFRTSLTIIKAAINRTKQMKDLPADLKLPVTQMQKGTDRMLRLVNQLLEFYKMQNDRLSLSLEQTDVIAFLRDEAAAFRIIAEDKNIDYQFRTFAHTFTMPVDRNHLDMIVYNLLSNAFKYTPAGGSIIMRVEQPAPQHIIISVADTGIGVDKEQQPHLFERFVKGTYLRDSIGVGLHLSAELARTHHGQISFIKTQPQGSIFSVTLPTEKSIYNEKDFLSEGHEILREEEKWMKKYSTQEYYRETSPLPYNPDHHVLIVEDDPDVASLLKDCLQKFFSVEIAANGQEALLRISDHRVPSLVISDVQMPVMDGIALTRKIRADKALSHLPVILLTAFTDEQRQLRGTEAGADAYITKPFSIPLLLARCEQLLKKNAKPTAESNHVVQPEPISEQQEEKVGFVMTARDKLFRDTFNTIVAQNLSNPKLNVDLISERMKISRTTLHNKIAEMTGKSPSDYIRDKRLELAAELIRKGEMNINEVATSVGINNIPYFSRLFKKVYGVSPSKFE